MNLLSLSPHSDGFGTNRINRHASDGFSNGCATFHLHWKRSLHSFLTKRSPQQNHLHFPVVALQNTPKVAKLKSPRKLLILCYRTITSVMPSMLICSGWPNSICSWLQEFQNGFSLGLPVVALQNTPKVAKLKSPRKLLMLCYRTIISVLPSMLVCSGWPNSICGWLQEFQNGFSLGLPVVALQNTPKVAKLKSPRKLLMLCHRTIISVMPSMLICSGWPNCKANKQPSGRRSQSTEVALQGQSLSGTDAFVLISLEIPWRV